MPGPSARRRRSGIATVFQDLALCDNLDVVANLFLGQEHTKRWPCSTRSAWRQEAWRLLRTLSAKIPSVRIPIAALSGGQRQTVAIARSLVGSPKVVMLDEPTAALGVAQTAEVLNLIERLRETGLGVILISHNMADVQAVADRIVVLRLGRNAAEFNVEEATTEQLVAAITGASDNVVAARARPSRPGQEPPMADIKEVEEPDAAAPARRRPLRRAADPGPGARPATPRPSATGCAAVTSAACRWSSAWS